MLVIVLYRKLILTFQWVIALYIQFCSGLLHLFRSLSLSHHTFSRVHISHTLSMSSCWAHWLSDLYFLLTLKRPFCLLWDLRSALMVQLRWWRTRGLSTPSFFEVSASPLLSASLPSLFLRLL